MKPLALVLTGHGINCEEETAYAFRLAGADTKILHVGDLVENPDQLYESQMLAFPGGFSFGDETGSGKALANYLRNHVGDHLRSYVHRDNLVMGICNGFQVLTQLGLLPSSDEEYSTVEVALTHNSRPRYHTRWIELVAPLQKCAFTEGVDSLTLPMAHGEGKVYAPDDVIERLREQGQIMLRYANDRAPAMGYAPYNPNGSIDDIAALSDTTGRVFGLMPHPERAVEFSQLPDWSFFKDLYRRTGKQSPTEGPGLMLFKNAVEYCK
jgi:phosphoribosylformylglycinamidine synthase subunit PurQ / glutaminase